MKTTVILSSLACLFFSCKQSPSKTEVPTATPKVVTAKSSGNSFTTSIETTHKKEAFLNNDAIQYDIKVIFGGHDHLEGTITQLTNGSKIKIEKKDGSTILFDNENVYATGITEPKAQAGARFDIFTWSYFFAFPYKLTDDGTVWSSEGLKKWGNTNANTARLTFKAGTGDAPKDWYVVYQNSTTKILEGAAYIVSFGKSLEDAEKEPHAIKYSNFTTVEGIPFANDWTFHMWTDSDGYGDQIGSVSIKNIQFVKNTNFNKAENALLINLP